MQIIIIDMFLIIRQILEADERILQFIFAELMPQTFQTFAEGVTARMFAHHQF